MFDKYKNTIVVFADFKQVNFLLDKTPLGENGCLSNFLGSLSMSPALHRGFSDLLRSPPATGKNVYYDVSDDVVNKYNNTKHSTIKKI